MLIDVQKAISQFRPVFDYVNEDETEEERKHRRMSAAVATINTFWDQVNKERPFYAKTVYADLHELRVLMQGELSEYEILDRHDDGYWQRARANAEAISTKVDDVCETIRNGLRTISATEPAVG